MKKITLAILAMVLVTVTTAFTWQRNDDATKKDVTNFAYFKYLGTIPDGENDAENWEKVESPANLCPTGNNVLCTIMAPIADPGDTHPDFTGIQDVRTSQSISSKVYKP
ncbi:MAG TPA: hypothetical protein VGB56_13175 [Flavisolibacter sp.]|jgi:hypothetical protein